MSGTAAFKFLLNVTPALAKEISTSGNPWEAALKMGEALGYSFSSRDLAGSLPIAKGVDPAQKSYEQIELIEILDNSVPP